MAEETATQRSVDHPEHAPAEDNLSAAASHLAAGAKNAAAEAGLDREGPSLATAALIGVGVAIIEPELIPGLLIGAGAVLAPKLFPALGGILRPLVKSVVKVGYSAATSVREAVAEVGEQVEDIVAEARSEQQTENGRGAAQPQPTGEAGAKRQRRQGRNPASAANL